jgi:hypothetical protein
MRKLVLLSGAVSLLAASSAWAQQQQDPVLTALGQEWSASETAHGHLAEAIQKLSQAYIAAQKKQAETDAYWAKYVAGLTPPEK